MVRGASTSKLILLEQILLHFNMKNIFKTLKMIENVYAWLGTGRYVLLSVYTRDQDTIHETHIFMISRKDIIRVLRHTYAPTYIILKSF
jgi:ABC-type dipeptide/oligopeptide/nickel transport system permease component